MDLLIIQVLIISIRGGNYHEFISFEKLVKKMYWLMGWQLQFEEEEEDERLQWKSGTHGIWW